MMVSLDQIQHDVESVIAFSQDYPFDVNMKDTIEKWYERKKFFIDLFDGEPIKRITKEPINFSLTQQEKDSMFEHFIDDLKEKSLLESQLDDTGYTLYNFLRDNRAEFFNNRVTVDYPSLKIRKGMKLLKCFKYFIPSFTDVRTAQDLASRYIQEDIITGHLYLSVHPLDFLTVSENNEGWRSCHSLDGEFRAGNLNYMLDDTTFMVYLAEDKAVQLKCFPEGLLWNSKKWRMLIHTNQFESVIYYNRQYPFNSERLLTRSSNYIIDKYAHKFKPPKVMGFKSFSLGERKVKSNYNYIFSDDQECVYDMRDVVDCSESVGYADLVYSSYYVPVVSTKQGNPYRKICYESEYKKDWDAAFHEEFDITIGRRCKCVLCGDHDIERSGSFLCEDCIVENDLDEDCFMKCDCCGRRIYPGFMKYKNVDGELLCQVCYNAINKEKENSNHG